MCSQLICISNSSQGSTPLGGMRCSLNIPGHPIIASKNVIMLPSNEMEKTATSDDYNSNHFQDATLLCSLIFQKQESIEMSRTNLTGLIRKKFIFSVETTRLKEDNNKSLTQGPRIFLTKCYRKI